MAYRTSKARRALQSALRDISNRTRIADKRGVDPLIRDYVIAAAIFLAHAEIENYIADVVTAVCAAAVAANLRGSQLPEALRAHLFIQTSNAKNLFGRFLAANSERDLLSGFSIALTGPAFAYVNEATTVPHFTGADVFGKIKYPSEDNLKKLFYRLGEENVFAQLSAILKQDAVALLQSISSLRTQLAHTGALPGISSKDIRVKLRDADRFVGALDRVIYSLARRYFTDLAWRNHAC